jgi:MFS family permease
MVYLPILITSMAVIVPFVIIAEKKRKMKKVFIGAILTLVVANSGLFIFSDKLFGLVAFLWLFFCGFNLLEATLPSLISKTAPGDLKGTAMGAYSSSQFMGAFVGGAAGGWLYGKFGVETVFLFSASAAYCWVIVAVFMQPPRYLANMLLSLDDVDESKGEDFVVELLNITGIEEVKLHFEESVAYLKVNKAILQNDDLQSLLNNWSSE